ncbi:stromal membrane-associated 1 isoform X1 [Labeo rohita]|uniref:Stromal membrane-associated 1 isoform X1 n=1 Tax=Labeo rohita TaxID=84645 RepID=A0A498MVC1_LABRO|nr:stromal membrane-associated 1 isoform X1 [Labeo rohita]
MTTRSEREKAQKLNEQHQAILSKMLREEDNKYCADCEAKGPRWASWNLGVFICIRCAGIHRNLGVHISRVKSVNLDQWTPEQIQSVQSMGNTKARQLYEAHLPENFRRPQTDQAVEFFIRDKYERKKYYDKNAVNGAICFRTMENVQNEGSQRTVFNIKNGTYKRRRECEHHRLGSAMKSSDAALPSVSSPSSQAAEKSKLEKEREKKKEEKKREKDTDKGNKPVVFEKNEVLKGLRLALIQALTQSPSIGRSARITKREDNQTDSRISPKKSAEPAIDLLGLDAPTASSGSSGVGTSSAAPISDDLDIFGPMVSNPLPSNTNTNQICEAVFALSRRSAVHPCSARLASYQMRRLPQQQLEVSSSKAAGSAQANSAGGAVAGATGTGSAAPAQGDLDLFSETSGSSKAEDSAKKPLSKDSILSLYGSSTVPQQPAQATAMFMGPSQMQFPAQPQGNFQAFPGMGGAMPPTTMMGAVMGQGGAMMGQNTGMMVGMTMPNGFMGNAQPGVMGLAPGMMGPQGMVPPQNMYAMQPGQQGQWNMAQINQQMSGMNLNGSGAPMAFGAPGAPMGGWVAPPSGQTLSTQLWK